MPSILFIHGAWVTSRCWDPFVTYFKGRGYDCLAPTWPHKDLPIETLRKNPPAALAGLGVSEIVDHYAQIIRALPSPPILIGHSFGGLFVQMLLDRGLGQAGVAISPAPPRGVLPYFYFSSFRANAPILFNPLNAKRIVYSTVDNFAYAFIHTLPRAEQERIYAEHVVPETGRIFFQAALAPFDPNQPTRVNFQNTTRAPLLITTGVEDIIVPVGMVRTNYRKYRNTAAITDYREFDGRTHWIIAQEGWQEVASYIEGWLEKMRNAAGARSM
jgi:pimeloyl-ACP methyl ester carboxylesterase